MLVILVLVIAFRLLSSRQRGPMHAPPQSVGVATVTAGSMPEILSALGTVTPTATVTVVPQLSGYLTAVEFKEGQDVAKGQELALIDPRPYLVMLAQYQATLARDQATLAQARSDLARYQRLYQQDSIAAQQVADQQFAVQADTATVQVDRANIASAQLDLTYCHIVSPVAGRVGLRLIDPGNYVTSASTTGIAVVTAMKPITVIFAIPQNQLADALQRFNSGAKLPVTALASDNTTKLATGTLSAIDNQVSTTTGTVNFRATFANTNEKLYPNEFVNIQLLVNTLTNVPLVPSQAIQTGTPGSYVYVVNPDHTVTLKTVTTGPSNGTDTVITSGLTPGEVVVTDGVDRLTNGAKIAIPDQSAAAGAAPGSPTAASLHGGQPGGQDGDKSAKRHGHKPEQGQKPAQQGQ